MIGVSFEVDILRVAGIDVGRNTNADEMQDERSGIHWSLDETLRLLVSSPDTCRAISPADKCGCGVS
jgi:hypothetical protein